MQILYFDNFRGFQNTFIELKKVNFLVGENSTGKTSVLKLIKILSDRQFLMTNDFNIEEAELGYFSEIVTSNSRKKNFEIGVFYSDDEENMFRALKMNFIEKNGIPFMNEVRLIDNTIDLEAKDAGKSFRFRFRNVELENKDYSDNKFYKFKKWVTTNFLKNKSFKIEKYEEFFMGDNMLLSNAYITSATLRGKEKRAQSFGFLFNPVIDEIAWMAPIRTEPRRTYDSYKTKFIPDGTHAPYILKKMLSKKKGSKERDRAEKILKKFGKDSGLFNDIQINKLGNSSTSPFEIHLYLNDTPLKITNVGYGVSQILPLVIEIISRNKGSWFAIQQPEIHLHPRAQAAFGDFVLKSCKEDDMNYIIETHSDYLIDRFRIKLNKEKLKESDKNDEKDISSQILFFNRMTEGNFLESIELDKYGAFCSELPNEFREFFLREELDLLNL